MFTGIVQAVGEIAQVLPKDGDLRLYVKTGKLALKSVAVGDSIAVNGVCLTAVELPGDGFGADVSVETIECTTIAQWQVGQPVNLEKAMTPDTHFGGHIVSGHVDGLGSVISIKQNARSWHSVIRTPRKRMASQPARSPVRFPKSSTR